MGLFSANQTISHSGVFRQGLQPPLFHAWPDTLSNASSQLCKAQGKKSHPDRSRQSPYALKHEV